MKRGIILALALTLSNTAFALNNVDTNGIPPALVVELNAWLDAATEYPESDTRPQIEFVETEQAQRLRGVADLSGGRIRGLYDAETGTIYLTEPWSSENPRDISILLHEMVHHRQTKRHWYCPQAQEWRAYEIQAQWLAEQNIEDDFYWPAIMLQSSCAKRDIHPE